MEEELDRIPLEEKTEYEEALIRVPELVESESNFLKFLRKHSFDAIAAARNLVAYWELRVKVFGRDRAFLPMTIRGAMQDDFDALATGFMQIIGTDAHGRAIIYHSKSKANSRLHHRSSLLKTAFYILHVASSDPENQRKGIVLIQNSNSTKMIDYDRMYGKIASGMSFAGPMNLKAVHIPSTKSWLTSASIHMPVMLSYLPKTYRVRINWYNALEDLEAFGISLSDVLSPRSEILHHDNFARWLDDQVQRETLLDGN